MRHSAPDETRPLTEFQEELVQLASQLNGDHTLPDYPYIGKKLNVRQGNDYVTDAVARFFREGEKALRSGVNESTILELLPLTEELKVEKPFTGRRSGNFIDDLVQSS